MKKERMQQVTDKPKTENLIVREAGISENSVVFHLMEKRYLLASFEEEKKISIDILEDNTNEENVEDKNTIRESILYTIEKVLIVALMLLVTVVLFESTELGIFLWISASLFCGNIIWFVISIIGTAIVFKYAIKKQFTNPKPYWIKRSVAVRMINFLELNKRLPRNMEEIRKSSRLNYYCTSIIFIEKESKIFIRNTIAMLIAIIISVLDILVLQNFGIAIVDFIVFTFFGNVGFVLLDETESLPKVFTKISKLISMNIFQRLIIPKKVNEEEFALVYCLANVWMQKVYPQYYNKEVDDAFFETIKKTYTIEIKESVNKS